MIRKAVTIVTEAVFRFVGEGAVASGEAEEDRCLRGGGELEYSFRS